MQSVCHHNVLSTILKYKGKISISETKPVQITPGVVGADCSVVLISATTSRVADVMITTCHSKAWLRVVYYYSLLLVLPLTGPYRGLTAARLPSRMAVFGAKVLWPGRESVTERYLQCGAMIDVQGPLRRTHDCTAPTAAAGPLFSFEPVFVETWNIRPFVSLVFFAVGCCFFFSGKLSTGVLEIKLWDNDDLVQ